MSRVHRGYYGPVPLSRTGRARSLLDRARAKMSRHAGLASFLFLAEIPHDQAAILEECGRQLSFPMWRPQFLPAGWRIDSAVAATRMGDAAIILLTRGRKRFEISQKPAWMPLAEMLPLANAPFTPVRLAGGTAYVLHGRFGGEPIDHSFWSTRQALLLELDQLVVELRASRVDGPGLPRLMHYGAAILRHARQTERSRSSATHPTEEVRNG